MTQIPRSAGVLLHPTSLPSPYGIGDMGEAARAFVDALARAEQTWWQMLPLHVPGHGGSPYSAESAFAHNPALIDPEPLIERGWLEREALDELAEAAASAPAAELDWAMAARKREVLARAWGGWSRTQEREAFEAFCAREAAWLDEYALYAALKEHHGQRSWRDWDEAYVTRQGEALEAARLEHAESIERHKFYQWVFAEQWAALREYARARGVRMIGDIPIFVAMDSADVWAERELFKLDERGRAEVVAGVPPDYFSETGQKWGNPVYDWDINAREGWRWWIARVSHATQQMDLVRIDHFRAFEDYWETPADEPTAVHGEWVEGPGDTFFEAIEAALGEVPFIAEDLGDVGQEVYDLRDRHELPGMKILQFAFGGEPDDPFLPHTYPERCVAYTGTHDNDTTQGWYDSLDDEAHRHRVRQYLGCSDDEVVEAMIEALYDSRAELVILPAQDLWELETWARMNTPATSAGNWSWRMTRDQLDDQARWDALAARTRSHDRDVEE